VICLPTNTMAGLAALYSVAFLLASDAAQHAS
jgi:hypothetical protein